MKKPNHKKRTIALVILLAILCIGGTELAACSYFAPDVYQQITAPVRHAAYATANACVEAYHGAVTLCGNAYRGACAALDSAAQEISQLWAQLTAPKEDPEQSPEQDSQEVSEPSTSPRPTVGDPKITELRLEGDQEILTGGIVNVVYFNQGDEDWAEQLYGTDDIGTYGCGPAALAMVVASLTDQEADPVSMAQWAVEHGYWASKGGSYHAIVEGAASDFGLQLESVTQRTPEALMDALLQGKVLVALMGPGHFTRTGHFILLRGITLTGDILVADPNSRERSLTVWDPQLLLDELSASTDHGAPLWALSPAEDQDP